MSFCIHDLVIVIHFSSLIFFFKIASLKYVFILLLMFPPVFKEYFPFQYCHCTLYMSKPVLSLNLLLEIVAVHLFPALTGRALHFLIYFSSECYVLSHLCFSYLLAISWLSNSPVGIFVFPLIFSKYYPVSTNFIFKLCPYFNILLGGVCKVEYVCFRLKKINMQDVTCLVQMSSRKKYRYLIKQF